MCQASCYLLSHAMPAIAVAAWALWCHCVVCGAWGREECLSWAGKQDLACKLGCAGWQAFEKPLAFLCCFSSCPNTKATRMECLLGVYTNDNIENKKAGCVLSFYFISLSTRFISSLRPPPSPPPAARRRSRPPWLLAPPLPFCLLDS